MRPVFSLLAICAVGLSACSNLANRRALYEPQPVNGPYTRMIRSGSWKPDRQTAPRVSGTEFHSAGDGKSVVDFR